MGEADVLRPFGGDAGRLASTRHAIWPDKSPYLTSALLAMAIAVENNPSNQQSGRTTAQRSAGREGVEPRCCRGDDRAGVVPGLEEARHDVRGHLDPGRLRLKAHVGPGEHVLVGRPPAAAP